MNKNTDSYATTFIIVFVVMAFTISVSVIYKICKEDPIEREERIERYKCSSSKKSHPQCWDEKDWEIICQKINCK